MENVTSQHQSFLTLAGHRKEGRAGPAQDYLDSARPRVGQREKLGSNGQTLLALLTRNEQPLDGWWPLTSVTTLLKAIDPRPRGGCWEGKIEDVPVPHTGRV